jgi:hypothetical protein
MRIKKEYLGQTHFCKALKINVIIEEGQEDLYKRSGMDYLFEDLKTDKKKYKGHNDTNKQGTGEHGSIDTEGKDNLK